MKFSILCSILQRNYFAHANPRYEDENDPNEFEIRKKQQTKQKHNLQTNKNNKTMTKDSTAAKL